MQPPGTPVVGFAYLEAAKADFRYLEAAHEVADALVWGQLECGGWDYKIDFDEENGVRFRYRHSPEGTEGRNQAIFQRSERANT